MESPLKGLLALSAAVLALSAGDVRAGIYKWVDAKGEAHYTDDLTRVPDEKRATVEKVVLPEGPATVSGAPAPPGDRGRPSAVKERDDQGRAPDYWKARVLDARAELRRLEAERKSAEETLRRANALTTPPGRLSAMKNALAELDGKIAERKKYIAEDLPEEARRAGALPGWLRVD